MRNKVGKTIIIEGPDGGGKSTLGLYLEERYKVKLYHAGNTVTKKAVQKAVQIIMEDGRLLLDRCPVISEIIYGRVIRTDSKVTESEMQYYFDWMKLNAMIIYCRPSIRTLENTKLVEKSHKTMDHINEVSSNIRKLIHFYDLFINWLVDKDQTILHFNRDVDTFENFETILETKI